MPKAGRNPAASASFLYSRQSSRLSESEKIIVLAPYRSFSVAMGRLKWAVTNPDGFFVIEFSHPRDKAHWIPRILSGSSENLGV